MACFDKPETHLDFPRGRYNFFWTIDKIGDKIKNHEKIASQIQNEIQQMTPNLLIPTSSWQVSLWNHGTKELKRQGAKCQGLEVL